MQFKSNGKVDSVNQVMPVNEYANLLLDSEDAPATQNGSEVKLLLAIAVQMTALPVMVVDATV